MTMAHLASDCYYYNGKWKSAIMASLFFGKKRYSELEKEIPKINPRMLSKELRDLEANGIVTRKYMILFPLVWSMN